ERGKGRNQVAATIKEQNCDRQINKIYRDKMAPYLSLFYGTAATETATGFKKEVRLVGPIHHRARSAPAIDCRRGSEARLKAEADPPLGKTNWLRYAGEAPRLRLERTSVDIHSI